MYDVKPIADSEYDGRSQVVVDWNYSHIQGTGDGTGDSEWFTPTDGIAAWADSKGDNPTAQEFLKIIGKRFVLKDTNQTSTYTIDDADHATGAIKLLRYHNEHGEQGPEYLGESSVGPEHGKVVEECDDVVINFLEVGDDGQHNPAIHTSEEMTVTDDYIDENRFMTYLPLGRKYSIRMKTVRGTKTSPWQSHHPGKYDPDHSDPFGSVSGQSVVEYTNIFNNTLPMLEDDGSLGLAATNFGFQVTVGGWSDANDADKNPHMYEIAYTTNDVVDFNVSDNTTIVQTTGRTYDVSTTVSTDYAVAVRGKQNGQVVTLVKNKSITSGAGGVPPSYTNYLSKDVVCEYFKIDLDKNNSNDFTIGGSHITIISDNFLNFSDGSDIGDMVALETPSYTSATISGLAADVESIKTGQRLEVMSEDMSTSFGTTIKLNTQDLLQGGVMRTLWVNNTAVDGYNANSEDGLMSGYNNNSHLIVAGATKWTRRLAEVTINQDVDIKQATIFVEFGTRYTPSNPCIIRVYQKTREEDAGTMLVKTAYGETSQAMNVEIRGSYGPRTLIVDAWDPATDQPNNVASIRGTLNLYGQPGTSDFAEQDQQGSAF